MSEATIPAFVDRLHHGLRELGPAIETVLREAALTLRERAGTALGSAPPDLEPGGPPEPPVDLAEVIRIRVQGGAAIVGIPESGGHDAGRPRPARDAAELAVAREFGSFEAAGAVPARPFLGPAAAEMAPRLAADIARRLVAGLLPPR
ncbi:conserved protein of unknown function [Rhodovastum atsumiense]|uniref:Uncharacterized protein n=1 Tax=Rhodovastum atsumiense TaxID=504468 RepID=A0A5M6IYQ0_9PROT|nr:hypothetical protein [Rhodovastum atsumiense]KAA5613474.1 hypothetical protein F1189_05305 [Rhodovastum atsumiense]CAH2603215.1 conserved protein of unknown function [Rhodovastum atsumiense]